MTDLSLEEQSLPSRPGVVRDDDELHRSDLLEQFYLTLGVTYLAAPRLEPSVVHERLDRLFRDDHSWRNAYEIEQLLCFVISEEQLETELERRLAEAKALKLEHVDVIGKELDATTSSSAKRVVLHRLLNDLQWFYAKRVQHRSASKRLMLRVSSLFMVALVALFLVLFIQFFAQGTPTALLNPQSPPPAPGPAASQSEPVAPGTGR